MHHDVGDPLLRREVDQREQVRLVRMHAAVTEQPDEMQPRSPLAGGRARRHQRRVRVEAAIFHCETDTDQVLHDDAPGAKIQVPDLAVAHLPFGESDGETGGGQQRARRV